MSAVTSVEIGIKRALGKLDAPAGLAAEIPARGLQELPLPALFPLDFVREAAEIFRDGMGCNMRTFGLSGLYPASLRIEGRGSSVFFPRR